jgi:hypothetical protein
MESDTVRTMGDSTLVDVWIQGKSRSITIPRQAIEAYLRLSPDGAQAMTETDRREFVRTHLSVVVSAATARVRDDPQVEDIIVDALGNVPPPAPGERRQGERRKGDRRQRNLGPPGGIERRG